MSSRVPTYALYGENEADRTLHLVHCESIRARSIRYGWHIEPHRHEALFQFLYVSNGRGVARLEGVETALDTASLVLTPPLAVHGFEFQHDIRGWVVSVPDAAVQDLAPVLSIGLDTPRHISLAEDRNRRQETEMLFKRVAGEYRHNGQGRTTALQALTTLLLVEVARLLDTDDTEAIPGERHINHVRRFRALLEETYRAPLAIGDYAARVGISPTQLNRLCRTTTGKSALGLLHDRILLEAKRELAFTSVGVAEIAYALGFRDPAYFSRFFAERAGVAPTRFRAVRQQAMAGKREY